jgi:hypothetical protein
LLVSSSRREDPCRSNNSICSQVAASSAPLLRMPFLWTGYLSARHDFWPRPLSAGTHPTVTTCKANTGKMPRFLRFTEPGDKCGVDQLAMTGRPAGRGKSRPVVLLSGGSGRLRDPLPEEKPRLPKKTGPEADSVRPLKSPISPSAPTRNVAFGSAPCLICALG